MKVFIGSSSEARNEMEEIARWIEQEGHSPMRWDDPGVFQPGDHLFEALRDISRKVDAAIFIFSGDDQVWFRQDVTSQPRDNVLVEYGLFVGVLGPKKTIICRKGQPKQPIDLQGILLVNLDYPNDARRRIRDWFSNFSVSTPLRPVNEGQRGIAIDISHDQHEWHRGSIFDLVDDDNRDPHLPHLLAPPSVTHFDFVKIEDTCQFSDKRFAAWRGLILGLPYHKEITATTRDEIVKWVRAGGRLLLMGFELGDRHHESNLNFLAESFGIRFNSDIVAPPFWNGTKPYDVPVILSTDTNDPVTRSGVHPVLDGVFNLTLENCCTLSMEPGITPLVKLGDNRSCTIRRERVRFIKGKLQAGYQDFETQNGASWLPVMAAAHKDLTEKGEVLAIGTWDLFGRNREFLQHSGNQRFLQNLLNWLSPI